MTCSDGCTRCRYDESVSRPGGASGEDPSREGTPRQDLLAALAFLDAVDTKVAAAERERFERLRDQVRSADDGARPARGLAPRQSPARPDHAVLSDQGQSRSTGRRRGADRASPTSPT